MATDVLTRTLIALVITGLGIGVYEFANRVAVRRVSNKYQGLDGFELGSPAILYFSSPTCAPCKTIQKPALLQLKREMGDQLQVIEVDASARPDLADYWGVLSVPTTFIIDKNGEPRRVNHGVTHAGKLQKQIEAYAI